MGSDGIAKVAGRFVAAAEGKCQEFDKIVAEAMAMFEELKTGFGEDSVSADEFLGIFSTFLEHFQLSLNELHARAEKERKDKEDAIKRAKKDAERKAAREAKAAAKLAAEQNQTPE
jgi:hypothetical protein